MILTEDGKLTRGKYKERKIRELTDGELLGSVSGFNPSRHATKADREFLAVELASRKLPIPAGFVEGMAVPPAPINGHSSKTAESGTSKGKNGSTNTNNGHAAAKAKTNGKPKSQTGRERYGDGNGEIVADSMYSSEEFRRRLSSGSGRMAPDTLTDWINNGLRVEYLPDRRVMIQGIWFLEWVERGCCPEPDPNDEENGQWVRSMDEYFWSRDERLLRRLERCRLKGGSK